MIGQQESVKDDGQRALWRGQSSETDMRRGCSVPCVLGLGGVRGAWGPISGGGDVIIMDSAGSSLICCADNSPCDQPANMTYVLTGAFMPRHLW